MEKGLRLTHPFLPLKGGRISLHLPALGLLGFAICVLSVLFRTARQINPQILFQSGKIEGNNYCNRENKKLNKELL
jgi:hypothetical protein